MRIPVEDFSQPVSDDAPCGDDLEYDETFALMETAMQAQEEQQMGDEVKEAVGPDWEAVGAHALDLLQRTRDLRVLVNLTMAGLNTDGLVAFHRGLTALNNAMEQFWDDIHPQLDPDDDLDPMMRMNVLQNLDDYGNVRGGIKRSPLVELKGVGRFSLRDIELATGEEQPKKDEDVTDLAIITGAFVDGDREMVVAVADAVQGSLDELERLKSIWSEKTNGYEQPGTDHTEETLREIQRALKDHAPEGTVDGTEEEAADAGAEAGAAPAAAPPGTINSHADVVKAIDRICDFYSKNEPSSPIPVLLRRAQRLVSKDFYQILSDVAPGGISEFENLRGQVSEE